MVHHIPKRRRFMAMVNDARREDRPRDPTTINFDLDIDQLPDQFIKADIQANGARHIVLMTDAMLELLSKAKTWYLDGTFRIVNRPFMQLFGIHAFIKHDSSMKQVPLAFILLSRRRSIDYIEVLDRVKQLLRSPVVQRFVLDYEKAAWQAIQHCFPGKDIKGCLFHYTQVFFL